MTLVLVYAENEGVAWLSRTCIKLGVMHGHHPFASVIGLRMNVCADHLAVSQGDTELTFHFLIACQLTPMAYCAYMGAVSFHGKP